MFIKKVNFLVCLALALVCGFGLSFLVGANVDEGMTSGDISKANLYNKQMPDPEASVIEELLRNDPDYLMATQSDLSIIKERVMILDELTKKTLKSCTKLPEFEDLMLTVSSLQAKAYNTNLAVDAANKGLEEILNGKSSPEYEVSSNNAYLGFEKIGNQLAIGQAILEATARYSENNEGETADSLATLAADWMVYCYDNAAVNGLDDKLASLEELMNSSDVANLGINSKPAVVCKNLNVVQKQAEGVVQKQAAGVGQKQTALVGQKVGASVDMKVRLSSKNVEGVLGKNINYANKRAGEQN
ncbi:MAG: hypothetical protein KBT49_04500 [Bacteroidetes bacterium]|nr:hypothetical protein [Candidatus Colenecus caballi]